MATEDAFTPRLGKIRDRGAAGGARLRRRVATTAKQIARTGTRSKFTGVRLGRGKASAMQASYATQRYTHQRMRRVVIKTHIAKPGKTVGASAFSKHLNYLQRDGVERDGSGGELYTREGREADGDAFAKRSSKDRHQFRFIVSPEDADKMKDLKSYTRELMNVMERDLGTRLDWVAVDHHNTGRSHTHIVVRGKDTRGRDLIIAPDYWSRGFRERASVLATQELGPRRELEIIRQRAREVEQDRLTTIDRRLSEIENQGRLTLPSKSTTKDRFDRSIAVQRLKYLQSLRLAEKTSPSEWSMQPGWQNALRAMGQRGDIIRAIAAGLEPGQVPDSVRFFDERTSYAKPLIGIVHRHGPIDELRDTRFLLVRDFDGNTWHLNAGAMKDGPLPPRGAVVEVRKSQAEPRQSDRTIVDIASRTGGYYSEAIHQEQDPSSSAAYRLAHKRRLEALRRSGLVERLKDGRWRIGSDHLERVGALEATLGSARVDVKSWVSIKFQIRAIGETWLDKVDLDKLGANSTATLSAAKKERTQFLRDQGILTPEKSELTTAQRMRLNAAELKTVGAVEEGKSNRKARLLSQGASFEGVFEKTINLGQGRFALIATAKEFALVPWRREMEKYRGQSIVIEARQRGVGWSLSRTRTRGISR